MQGEHSKEPLQTLLSTYESSVKFRILLLSPICITALQSSKEAMLSAYESSMKLKMPFLSLTTAFQPGKHTHLHP